MDDPQILHNISELTNEEHELLHAGETSGGLDDTQRTRLKELQVEIDRLWDLLRQRRARRHAGLDPEGAQERAAGTVEHYQQ